MVNLKVKPYNLDEESIRWVEDTIANMSIEEKIGQLFVNMGASRDEEYLKSILDNYHIGAVRYNPGKAEEVYEQNRILQENSKIPLLLSANLEAGGNGIAVDGTELGKQMLVAATGEEEMAYKLGLVAGREGSSVGCNWAFAPIIDIDMNYRNPITNVRTYGSNPHTVLKMAKSYISGISESNVAACIKHFPGDGVDERDQHLLTSVNSLSVKEWEDSFGMVYKKLIDQGVQTVMAGHIIFPAF